MIGLASIVVDNTPIMAAVIQMNSHMPDGHRLLVTLATGVSGNP
jgi:Na+/H+ antiporter NhaD/arsenite permease-like protein